MAGKSNTKKKSTSKKVEVISNDIEIDEISESEIDVDDKVEDEPNIEEPAVVAEKSNNDTPTTSASKVFGQIAAFKWWKTLGYINVLWTLGFILIFLAIYWHGDVTKIIGSNLTADQLAFNKQVDANIARVIANIVFASLLSGFSLIALTVINTLYYVKNIKSFNSKYELPSALLAFIPLGFIPILVFASIETKSFYGAKEVSSMGYTKPKFVMPHVYIILMGIILVVIIASWFATWNKGALDFVQDPNFVPTPDKMEQDPPNSVVPAGFLYLLIAPIKGFVNAADLIIFLMIMGGFLAIVTESGALEAGLGRMVKALKGKEIILVPILFVLFSIGGTTYGMAEESLPFYLLLIPVFLAAGFDSYTAVLTILFGAGLGTAASILNPFVVNTAIEGANKGITGSVLTPSNGIIWRSVIYALLIIPGCAYVTWYAWRVKKDPTKSKIYDLQAEHKKEFSFNMDSLPEFTAKRKAIIAIFGLTFLAMIISVISWEKLANTTFFNDITKWIDTYLPFLGGVNKKNESLIGAWGTWYLVQMGFLFFFSTLIVASLSWKGSKHFIDKFMFGVGDFIGVGMVIAISRGISIVVGDTGLDQIIIGGLSGMIKSVNNVYGVTVIFFLLFFALSFLIPSTSGFASAVFPLIGPAIGGYIPSGGVIQPSVLPGLTVSGSIASFSLASGIVNISMPSGGIFVSALSLSKVPLGKFYKGSWGFLVALFVGSLALLLIGQAVNGASPNIF